MTHPVLPPLPHQFDDIQRKLTRANAHTKTFNNLVKDFWKSARYDSEGKTDYKGRLVCFVTYVDQVPPDLSLLISESAHQLRSALDHLMWMLARPQGAKQEGNVQFPLVRSRKKYISGTDHMMPGVRRGVRTVIESLQPYHSRKWPKTALLGQLRAISNWDKHRSLLTTMGATTVMESKITLIGGARIGRVEHFRPILKPGAIIARIEVLESPPGSEVRVKPNSQLLPVFDEGAPKEIEGLGVVDTLLDCARFIRIEVLPRFAKFFPA